MGIRHLEILSGWKEIAKHLGKGIRTVQRYERELGLPVRRPAGKLSGSVLATIGELDAWVSAMPLQQKFRLPQGSVDHATLLTEFRTTVQEARRLREQTEELRARVATSLELLQESLRYVLTPPDNTPKGSELRLLGFDGKRKVN
jgi:hypothetical protein